MSAWRPRPLPGDAGITGVTGVEVWGCEPAGTALSLEVSIDPHGPPAASAEVQREWAALCAGNPKLFDGRVLNVVWFDHERGSMLARADTYQRLAVQPRVRTGVRLLGVTALVTARDRAGREHVLLGRRGAQTRVYGGMWELGPAGGLDSWHPGQVKIDPAAIIEQALDEAEEEAGLALSGGRIIGLVRDDTAFSYDVIVRVEAVELEKMATRADGWEYEEVAWVAVEDLELWERRHASEIIGPSRAVMRALGWV